MLFYLREPQSPHDMEYHSYFVVTTWGLILDCHKYIYVYMYVHIYLYISPCGWSVRREEKEVRGMSLAFNLWGKNLA